MTGILGPRARRGFAIGVLVGLCCLGAAAALLSLARDRATAMVEARAERLQQKSGWVLSWQELALELPLRLRLRQVRLATPQGDTVATIDAVEVAPSLWAALGGAVEDADVTVERPRLTLTAKTIDALRALRRAPTDDDDGERRGRRWQRVAVVDGEVTLTLPLQRPRWAPAQLRATDLSASVERGDGDALEATARAQLDASLGGAVFVATATRNDGEWQATAGPEGGAHRLPLPQLDARLPAGLWLELAPDALRLGRGTVTIADVALGRGKATWARARVVEASRRGDGYALVVRDASSEAPTALVQGFVPLALPPGALALRARAVAVGVGQGADVTVEGAELRLGPSAVTLDRGRVHAADAMALLRPEAWRSVRLDGPRASIALHDPLLALDKDLPARLTALAERRKTAAARIEAEADAKVIRDDPPDKRAPATAPAQGWIAALRAGHAALLGLHPRLDAAWRLDRLAATLDVAVAGGAVALIDAKGVARLGVDGLHVGVGALVDGERALRLRGSVFDDAGPIGTFGVVGRRIAAPAPAKGRRARRAGGDAFVLDLNLAGGGVAQLLGDRLGGLAVGDGANLDVVAQVAIERDGVHVEGRVAIENMGIRWWRLADRPIDDFAVSWRFAADARRDPAELDVRFDDIRLGEARLHARAEVTRIGGNPRVLLELAAPLQDCGAMLASVPPSLLPTIGTIRAKGPMGFRVAVRVPLPQVGATAVDLALADTLCTVERFGDIHDDLHGLAGDFVRPVNENGTLLDDVPIGPKSGSWTPAVAMPRHVLYAMWATEDSFFKHRGVAERLVEKALAIDLSYGRFIYGGSTVTQQLAKNLYLRRGKALSRKFEEMLIAWQMEKVLGKARILELYCNAVEFGPKIYGITRAARAYFDKTPGQLTHVEALFLGVIKPRPSGGWGHFKAGAWTEWFSTKIGKYMDKLVEEGMLTEAERDAQLPYRPVFADPSTVWERMGTSAAPASRRR